MYVQPYRIFRRLIRCFQHPTFKSLIRSYALTTSEKQSFKCHGILPQLSSEAKFKDSIGLFYINSLIFGGTIRENILFHNKFQPKWYSKIISSCCLDFDLDVMKLLPRLWFGYNERKRYGFSSKRRKESPLSWRAGAKNCPHNLQERFIMLLIYIYLMAPFLLELVNTYWKMDLKDFWKTGQEF